MAAAKTTPELMQQAIAAQATELSSREAVFGLDEQGQLVYANSLACHMYDLPDDYYGHSLAEYCLAGCSLINWSEITQRLAAQDSFFTEETHYRSDGAEYPVELGFRRLELADFQGVLLVIRDLTERKGLQKSLAVARARADQYFQLGGLIVAAISPDGTIIDVNDSGCEVIGQDHDRLVGQTVAELIVKPEDQKQFLADWWPELLAKTKPVVLADHQFVRPNGEERFITWHLNVLRDDDGQPVVVTAAGLDLTEKKRNEDIVRRQNEISHKLVALMTEFVAGAGFDEVTRKIIGSTCQIVGCDNGLLAQVDPSEQAIRYTHEWNVRGSSPVLPSMPALPIADVPESTQKMNSKETMVVNRPSDLPPESPERQLAERNGVESFVLVPLPAGTPPIGALLFLRRHKSKPWTYDQVSTCELVASLLANFILRHREHQASLVKLKELSALKNTFIQVVSHQVRTPLNSIRWSLETLLSGELGPLADSQRDFLRVVHDAETEILARLDDMLTALDIEEGRVVFRRGPFAFDSLWSSVRPRLQRACKIKGVKFVQEVPDKPINVDIDAERIRKAMTVLVDNAVEYTKKGGQVTVRLTLSGARVRFAVSDTGVGIPEAEQGRVFDRFFRASNATMMKPDATGLGLAIARYYVEQHNGEIGFTSKEGEGSTFWFELPLSESLWLGGDGGGN